MSILEQGTGARPTRRARVALGGVAALALAVCGSWIARPRAPSRATEAAPARAGETQPTGASAGAAPMREGETRAAPGPLLLDAYADADGPCVGDPVTFTAVVDDARKDGAEIQIGPRRGERAVLTFASPGERSVVVRAFDRAADESRTLRVTVRDCGADHAFVTVAARATEGLDRYAFKATTHRCDADAGCNDRPTSGAHAYAWDFGDGTGATTDEPYVEHDYAERPQSTAESTFVVRVRVTAARDEALEGATSFALPNAAYRNRTIAGLVTPSIVVGDVRRGEREVQASLRVVNHEGAPVRLENARVRLLACDGDVETAAYDVRASALLGDAELPPGGSATTLRLDRPGDGVCRAVVELRGVSGGAPASAVVGVAIAEPKGTVLDERASEDRAATHARLARVHRALAVLGRDPEHGGNGRVSEDEIRALLARGLLE